MKVSHKKAQKSQESSKEILNQKTLLSSLVPSVPFVADIMAIQKRMFYRCPLSRPRVQKSQESSKEILNQKILLSSLVPSVPFRG
jgi:hypothetical protein